jgi:hypothetical protein
VAGGAWSPDGTTIVFGGDRSAGLMSMPAAGGPLTKVTTVDAARKDVAHFAPTFLPHGRRFLFRVAAGIELGSLDGPERTRLLDVGASAICAAPGYLVYVRDNQHRITPAFLAACRSGPSWQPSGKPRLCASSRYAASWTEI